jgi:hypothetical protein
MRGYIKILFWILTFIILTLIFGRSYGGLAQSFYFVSFLFPVIVGTSYLFNSFLVPRFLLTKKYFKFGLYFLYTLIFSVYLELLVMTLSLTLFANYQFDKLNPQTTDIYLLTIVLYFFVFLNTVIVLIREFFMGQERQEELETEKDKLQKGYLIVRSERKNTKVLFDHIVYVESVGNYIRVHASSGDAILSKEKISSIEERLPDHFLRIHRSILVNMDKISSFNKESVIVEEIELPLGRKYKEYVFRAMGADH